MKLLYILYNDSNSNRVKVEVTGKDLDECESSALGTPGINKIAWARVIDGQVNDIRSHARVVSDTE